MRIIIGLALLALVLAWVILTNIGAAQALADLAARPVLALTRDDGTTTVPVQRSGQQSAPGEARILGGRGVVFGYSNGYALPDGSLVTCTIRFRTMSCTDGWSAVRP